MTVKALFFSILSLTLVACSGVEQKYRDTTDLETPPRLVIVEKSSNEVEDKVQKNINDYVFLDDMENPSVLKIKKLFDRSWDLVGQALSKRKIEITDMNRDKGIYFVKYDPGEDSNGRVFGNVRFFLFEDEYQEAEYKISIGWHDTETEVRVEMINQQEVTAGEDEDEELADGSAKLIKALYDEISNVQTKE